MPHALPTLPYAYDELEPHFDAMTMHVHHSRYHQAYVNGLNSALEGTDFAEVPVEDLISQIHLLPESLRLPVRNNGGGHANHSLFWTSVSPDGGGVPAGDLANAIDRDLGGYDGFKTVFTRAAQTRFGSGWAWLTLGSDGVLKVESTANQDSPLMGSHVGIEAGVPILTLDVWEHAYYLHYQNRRPDYISAFFNIIDWAEASRRYEVASEKLARLKS